MICPTTFISFVVAGDGGVGIDFRRRTDTRSKGLVLTRFLLVSLLASLRAACTGDAAVDMCCLVHLFLMHGFAVPRVQTPVVRGALSLVVLTT